MGIDWYQGLENRSIQGNTIGSSLDQGWHLVGVDYIYIYIYVFMYINSIGAIGTVYSHQSSANWFVLV